MVSMILNRLAIYGYIYIYICPEFEALYLLTIFNAIAYGWTREDFVQLLAIGVIHFDDWYLEEQGILPPEGSEGQSLQSSHRQSDASITDKLTTSTASCISNNDQQ